MSDSFEKLVRDIVDERVGEHEAVGAEKWVSAAIASEHSGASVDVLLAAARSGALLHGRPSTDYRFKLSDVDAWMRSEADRRRAEGRRKRTKATPGQSPRTREIIDDVMRKAS